MAAAVAEGLYLAAQIELQVSRDLQAAADAEWAAARHDAAEAAAHWYEPWVAIPDAYRAGVEAGTAWRDEQLARQAYAAYQALMALYFSAEIYAIFLRIMAVVAAVLAVVTGIVAAVAAVVARNAAAYAKTLAAQAAGAERAAAAAEAEYQRLLREYQAEQHRAKHQPPSDARPPGHTGGSGNHGGGSGSGGGRGGGGGGGSGCSLFSFSGLVNCGKQAVRDTVGSAVNCVEHPSVGSCASTVVTIVVAVGTDGAGSVALDAAEQAAKDLAEEEASSLIPSVIYRGGTRTDLQLTDSGTGVSFRDSLSNPVVKGLRPVLRPGEKYFAVDTSRLPSGSVIYDNNPIGHVGVFGLAPQTIRDAIIEEFSGRFPR